MLWRVVVMEIVLFTIHTFQDVEIIWCVGFIVCASTMSRLSRLVIDGNKQKPFCDLEEKNARTKFCLDCSQVFYNNNPKV